MSEFVPHRSHWGVFSARETPEGGGLEVRPPVDDPDPSPLLANFIDAARHPARVARPAIRRGWLDSGPGSAEKRGRDEFVEVDWNTALDLVAAEIKRVRERYGSSAVFGGSYGWSSAGRFHHAQSQVHRFLNVTGGYVRSVNSYSAGAAHVIVPHVLGPFEEISRGCVKWGDIVEWTDLIVCFGGMAAKNAMVSPGGPSRHTGRTYMAAARRRGTQFVLISPLRDDLPAELDSAWLPIRPGTDTALMLGLAHTLASRGLVDRAFVDRYCQGYDIFEDYLFGRTDGEPEKTAVWASAITHIPSDTIVRLALDLVGRRTLVTVSQSLQRGEHGEQPVWMAITLAAMLGQIGLPGAGVSYGLGSMADIGAPTLAVPLPTLPQGSNKVRDYIPVARIADMLLQPGLAYSYNGSQLRYPDIRLVYWAGGNPFHHHQDINRLRRAFRKPDTIVVHESAWTATARHADVVLPATLTLERPDIGAAAYDPLMVAMRPVIAPYAQAKDDYAIFSLLAQRLGREKEFTEGRSVMDWLRMMYEGTRSALETAGHSPPDFDAFWASGELLLPTKPATGGILADFRRDPVGKPLPTASGKIEVFSHTIDGFGYDDCGGHPAWLAPREVASESYPLHLVTNQPATRLHSQLDFARYSRGSKQNDREPVRLSATDANLRGIRQGDIVRIFNDRGSCLATASISEAVRPGVVHLPTGAWYDPESAEGERPTCVHGNPNVLTRDAGTSKLAQACSGQWCCVEVERFEGPVPPVQAFEPPAGVK
ncbi:MAG: molybdopterin-dependent oxidoreductase, partial [Gammaproteobacteria bacterium]|nr:molybdopterin-dependent oxidoreductase [Gammaproteobacteria bacterium]